MFPNKFIHILFHKNSLQKYIITLGIILLAFLSPLISKGIPKTHDGENHLARLAAYSKAFHDFQIPPRFAGNLNFGFGTPVLNFFYPLPGYIGSFFHALGLSYETSFKGVLLLAFLIGPFGMFFYLFRYYSINVSFLGALLFGLLPYRFLNLYVRGDVGELLAISIIPWILFYIDKTIKTSSINNIVIEGFFWGILIMSHNAVSLLFFPICIVYMLIQSKGNINKIFISFVPCVIGFLMSFYFWFPALLEQKFTNAQFFAGSFYENNFLPLTKLIYSPWGFGDSINKLGSLSPELGIIPFVLLCISIPWLIFNKKCSLQLYFWLLIFCLSIIFSLRISSNIWAVIPILKLFQFPWRFMMVSSFVSVLLIVPFFEYISVSKKMLVFITIIVIIVSIRSSKINEYIHHSDSWYDQFAGSTYYHGEASTIWTAGDPSKKPEEYITFIDGFGSIESIKHNTNIHEYMINTNTSAKLLDNTLYYPGWNVYINGIKTLIEFQNPEHRGLITFFIPQGNSHILVKFEETKMRKTADLISLVTLIFCILALYKIYIPFIKYNFHP
jgi:uncharacterized membrane protein